MDQEKKNGPIAVVTGCSRGIGYETTNLLALNGFKVYAGVRSLDSCKKLKSLAKKYKNIIIQEIRLEKDSSIKKFDQK